MKKANDLDIYVVVIEQKLRAFLDIRALRVPYLAGKAKICHKLTSWVFWQNMVIQVKRVF